MALNPVTFQVIQSRLNGIVQEMQENIFRTGYSVIVRESHDASCLLMDAAGDVVGAHTIVPVHLTSLPAVVRAIKRDFPNDIQPGDAFLTNHPYLSGVAHSMDIAIVSPVFHDGKVIAFCGSIAHKSDLGGVVPGTANAGAREIFQEGIQYPPIRLERGGQIVRDIEAILAANSRTPEVVLGDLRGQVGVARLGERRIAEAIGRYGIDDVVETFALMQDVAERGLRAALAAWPDGTFEAEHFLDRDLTETVRFHVRVEKRGDRIHFDFSDCADQVTAPINIHPSVVRGSVAYALLGVIDPTLENNGGTARVIELTLRRGSIVDAIFPAPTNSYSASSTQVAQICIRALGGFSRERRVADCSLAEVISIGGRRDDGTSYLEYELSSTAAGGRSRSDGPSAGSTLLGNVRCAPIEIIESEFPTRILKWELVTDSGGPGEFRGGLGARRKWKVLNRTAQITLRGAGHAVPAQPTDGGKPGRLARFVINDRTPGERIMPPMFSGVELATGEEMVDERGGGGGFGDPKQRPFERILDDVIDGYVSLACAVNEYGVDRQRLEAGLAAWDAQIASAS